MFDSPVLAVIVGCEIGFWILVGGGLALRYFTRQNTASAIVLALVPVLDVVLLVAVAVDLHAGADVVTVHVIAGMYLGASIAFGPRMVRWADERFAYYFAGGPKPTKAPKTGPEAVRYEWRLFWLWLIAAVITIAAIALLVLTVANDEQSTDLYRALPILGLVTLIWFVTGPAWAIGRRGKEKLTPDA